MPVHFLSPLLVTSSMPSSSPISQGQSVVRRPPPFGHPNPILLEEQRRRRWFNVWLLFVSSSPTYSCWYVCCPFAGSELHPGQGTSPQLDRAFVCCVEEFANQKGFMAHLSLLCHYKLEYPSLTARMLLMELLLLRSLFVYPTSQ